MKKTDKQLYDNLMKLCIDSETLFHFVDHKTAGGYNIRVFDYHYASYSDWLLPDALWCRGTTFVVENEKPIKLLVLPMKKFFNLNENPLTMNLDLTKIRWYEEKRDGSLISSFVDADGVIRLKSKTTPFSDQAQLALSWLYDIEHQDLLDFVKLCEEQNCTVNFEWTSPQNRIVLPYQTSELRILNVISRDTREYIDLDVLYTNPTFVKNTVDRWDANSDVESWLKEVEHAQKIEGYVVYHEDCVFKLKCEWYRNLHTQRGDITGSSSKRLWLVANGNIDDLMNIISHDDYARELVEDTERHYKNILQTVLIDCAECRKFLHLERVRYVGEVNKICQGSKISFTVAMKMYDNDDINVVETVRDIVKRTPQKFI